MFRCQVNKAARQARKLGRKQATESAEATPTHGIIHQASINTAGHNARQDAARAATGTACTSSRYLYPNNHRAAVQAPPNDSMTTPQHAHRSEINQPVHYRSVPEHPSSCKHRPYSGRIHRSKGITNRYPLTRGRTSPNLSPEPLSAPEPPLSPARAPNHQQSKHDPPRQERNTSPAEHLTTHFTPATDPHDPLSRLV